MNLSLDVLRRANALRMVYSPEFPLRNLVDAALNELLDAAAIIDNATESGITDNERHDIAKCLGQSLINLDLLATRVGVDLSAAVMSKWNEASNHLNSRLRILDTRWGVEVQELWDNDDDAA